MKKLFAALLVLALAFTGCAMAETLSVIATPSPHAEVVRLIEEDLAAAGYELELIEVTDYVTENPAVAGGDVMINFFQHIPYLDGYNASVSEDEQLAAVIPTHFEPMGIYPGTKTSLEEIAEGDAIAVPNDPTNMTRAFLLLADAGLISVPEGTTLESVVTPDDITGDLNPNGLVFYEANAELIPGLRGDVAFAIINGNNAALAGLNPNTDAAYAETADSLAGQSYVNVFAVKPENAEADFVKALRLHPEGLRPHRRARLRAHLHRGGRRISRQHPNACPMPPGGRIFVADCLTKNMYFALNSA